VAKYAARNPKKAARSEAEELGLSAEKVNESISLRDGINNGIKPDETANAWNWELNGDL
jgi:hypothetical protein